MNLIASKSPAATHDTLRACRNAAPLTLSLLLLQGCGGGGGSASVQPTIAAAVSPANAATIAAAAYRGASVLELAAGMAALASANAVPTVASGAATTACAGGGSKTISAPATGSIIVGFKACSDGGRALSGGITMTYSGRPGTAGLDGIGHVTFSNFSITAGGSTTQLIGDYTLTGTTQSASHETVTVSGTSIAIIGNAGTEYVSEFNCSLDLSNLDSAGTGNYAYTAHGTVTSSTRIGGYVFISTPTAFAGIIGGYPSTGQLVALSSNNSAARLTANSATAVTIDSDVNGDGQYGSSTATTWDALIGM